MVSIASLNMRKDKFPQFKSTSSDDSQSPETTLTVEGERGNCSPFQPPDYIHIRIASTYGILSTHNISYTNVVHLVPL